MGAGNTNSGPHIYEASTLLTEPSPQTIFFSGFFFLSHHIDTSRSSRKLSSFASFLSVLCMAKQENTERKGGKNGDTHTERGERENTEETVAQP